MTRKFSDNKYDKPEYDAKIEKQTLKALETLIGEPITKQKTEDPKKA